MFQWQRYAVVFVGVLLLNEIIISSVILSRKNAPASEQSSYAPPSEQRSTLLFMDVDAKAAASDSEATPSRAREGIAGGSGAASSGGGSVLLFKPASTNNATSTSNPAHDQLDILKNAAITYDAEARIHQISYRAVSGSWKLRTKDPNNVESFHLASRKNPWLQTSYDYFDARGCDVTFDLSGGRRAMFVPAIPDATHCVHDLLFSLLPVAASSTLKDYEAVAVARPDAGSGDYCTTVLRELNWFQKLTLLSNNTCLDEIYVPPFIYNRYPRGRERKTQIITNEYISSEDLPMGVIMYFHQQMWKTFIAGNEYLHRGKKGRIIFDARMGADKGVWANVHDIAEQVREELDPELFSVEVIDNINALSVREQAAMYHDASIMVAPHGGSIANVIFMKPPAVIYEVSCGESSWIKEWASDLKIRHMLVHADDDGRPCKFEGQMTYLVEPTLVKLILDVCWQGRKKKGAYRKRNSSIVEAR